MSVLKTEQGRKRLPASERREQVLEVAASVFSEKGYRVAQVTDIVESARIGRGTFYLYFDSKRDVFVELLERYFNGFAEILSDNSARLAAAIESGGDVLQVWRDNIMRILEYHSDNPALTSAVYRDGFGRDEDFAERVEELSVFARKQLREQFAILEKNGLIRKLDPDLITTIVMGSVVYVIMEHVVRGGGRDLERIARETMEYHLRALAPSGAELERAIRLLAPSGTGSRKKSGGTGRKRVAPAT